MRRSILPAAVALFLLPLAGYAQPRILAGAGFSTPIGDFGDTAETGWHATAGLQLGVPAIPVAARADGAYHSFGDGTASSPRILSGALSLVFNLPGVGLVPYFLAGVGSYRMSAEDVDAVTDGGFHGAFGVNIGALGFGGFGEVRFVNVNRDSSDTRFVTATLGLRL